MHLAQDNPVASAAIRETAVKMPAK